MTAFKYEGLTICWNMTRKLDVPSRLHDRLLRYLFKLDHGQWILERIVDFSSGLFLIGLLWIKGGKVLNEGVRGVDILEDGHVDCHLLSASFPSSFNNLTNISVHHDNQH